MRLNTDPDDPPRLPCIRDLALLTSTLLPPALVMLASLEELRRRCGEIDATHQHFREETPLVLAYEERRRRQLQGELHLTLTPSHPHQRHA